MRHFPQRPATALLVFVACAALVLASPALALGEGATLTSACAIDTTLRTAAEVSARWDALKPTYAGSPYSVAPSTAAPYAIGTLQPGFLEDGVRSLNWIRYLGGVPDDVVLDPGITDYAQYGAVLLAASDFSHYPAKPASMDDVFYSKGLAATSRSNIGYGYPTLAAFSIGCGADSDPSNISRLGHRRWILNPAMAKTGMGYADAFSTTYAFDASRSYAFDYEAIKWPCAGYFPVEAMQTSTAWSITLNPAKYKWTSAAHTVTMQRVGDGRTWTFTSADTDVAGKYFNFDTGGYGVANCFVFRPDAASLGAYAAGDSFDITLSGGIFLCDGVTPATITYRTTFMSLASPPTSPAPPPPASQPASSTPSSCTPSPVYRFYNKLKGVHFYTMSHEEKLYVLYKLAHIYKYEGTGYAVNTSNPSNSTPLYRFYNKKTGVHFYTASYTEKLDVLKRLADTYTYEGVAYNVCGADVLGATVVYRFFNVKTGVHFYTASEAERDNVIATLSHLYKYEGPAYRLAP